MLISLYLCYKFDMLAGFPPNALYDSFLIDCFAHQCFFRLFSGFIDYGYFVKNWVCNSANNIFPFFKGFSKLPTACSGWYFGISFSFFINSDKFIVDILNNIVAI